MWRIFFLILWPFDPSIPCILYTVYATRDPCRLGVSNSLRFSKEIVYFRFTPHVQLLRSGVTHSKVFFFFFSNALDKPLGYHFFVCGAGSLTTLSLTGYYSITSSHATPCSYTYSGKWGMPMFCNSGDGLNDKSLGSLYLGRQIIFR